MIVHKSRRDEGGTVGRQKSGVFLLKKERRRRNGSKKQNPRVAKPTEAKRADGSTKQAKGRREKSSGELSVASKNFEMHVGLNFKRAVDALTSVLETLSASTKVAMYVYVSR